MKTQSFLLLTIISCICIILTSGKPTSSINLKRTQIGNQIWSIENLNVSIFGNGDIIPEAKSKVAWEKACKEGRPAWCYYNESQSNGDKYGKLYNWYAVHDVRGLAPKGWHIPTYAEFGTLINYLGKEAGNKMKMGPEWNGNNNSGFSALPSGFRNVDGTFADSGQHGYFWTSAEPDGKNALNFELSNSAEVTQVSSWKSEGLSCRLLKD
jgi:uncharacterized protein (TIGR02145 family)